MMEFYILRIMNVVENVVCYVLVNFVKNVVSKFVCNYIVYKIF